MDFEEWIAAIPEPDQQEEWLRDTLAKTEAMLPAAAAQYRASVAIGDDGGASKLRYELELMRKLVDYCITGIEGKNGTNNGTPPDGS